jgi:hypothetical protein
MKKTAGDPGTLRIKQEKNETEAQTRARLANDDVFRAAITGWKFSAPIFGAEVDVTSYENELRKLADAAESGDLIRIRQMLITQANTLDMIFNRIAVAAADETDEQSRLDILQLALLAQEQSHQTIRTFHEMTGQQ